jgi:Synergist-CTERM protein sorting domain-containing protein
MAVLGIALANMMDLTATDGAGQRHADAPRTASMSFHLVNHGPATVVPNFHIAADGPLDTLVGDAPVSCFGEICMLDHELAPGASVDMSFVAHLGDAETHVTITASALGVDELTPADNATTFTIAAAPPSADDGGCAAGGGSGLALVMLAMPLVLRRRR